MRNLSFTLTYLKTYYMGEYFLVQPCLSVNGAILRRNHLDNNMDKRLSGDL